MSMSTSDKPKLPKSAGQKVYDRILWGFNWVGIAAASLGLTYAWKYSSQLAPTAERFTNKIADGLSAIFSKKEPNPDIGKNVPTEKIAGAAQSISDILALQWGGNLFLPLMKFMDDNQERFVTWWDKKFGSKLTEEEQQQIDNFEATGQKRFGESRSWGDWIGGRAIVLASVYTATSALSGVLRRFSKSGNDAVISVLDNEGRFKGLVEEIKVSIKDQSRFAEISGKDEKEAASKRNNAIEAVATKLAAKTPVGEIENSDPALAKSIRTHRVADLLVLDIWLTGVAVALQFAASRFLSNRKKKKETEPKTELAEVASASRLPSQDAEPAIATAQDKRTPAYAQKFSSTAQHADLALRTDAEPALGRS